MRTTSPPPEFPRWDDVWTEHQLRGRKIAELEAENARLRAELAALSPPQPVAGWRERCVVVQYTDGSCDVDSPCHAYWLDTKGYWRDWENGEDKFRTDRKGRFDSPVAAMDALAAACKTTKENA